MDLATTLLVGVPAQLGVFLLVPLAWWLQSPRPDGALHRYLGLRGPDAVGDPMVLAATVLAALGFLGSALLGGPAGWSAFGVDYFGLLALGLVAVVQTALSEELFFRGFVLRWVGERRAGWAAANLLQALACGLVRAGTHWVFIDRGLAPCLAAFALGVGPALMAGWVRQRTGSILLPWAAHGAGNLVAGLIVVLSR